MLIVVNSTFMSLRSIVMVIMRKKIQMMKILTEPTIIFMKLCPRVGRMPTELTFIQRPTSVSRKSCRMAAATPTMWIHGQKTRTRVLRTVLSAIGPKLRRFLNRTKGPKRCS